VREPPPRSDPAARSPDRAAGTGDAFALDTSLPGPLIVPHGVGREAELSELAARATHYATRARGNGTRRAYRSAWQGFVAWCHSLGREPLAGDADTIAMYVVRCADEGLAVSTLRVHLAAIRTAHLLANVPLDLRHPRLAMVLEGITRSASVRPRRQAAPAVPDILRRMLATAGLDPAAAGIRAALVARDRAMLLLGFGAALRRSELVALRLGGVTVVSGRGVKMTVGRSKTDQQGRGQDVAIWANPGAPDFCPLAVLEAWLEHRWTAADLAGMTGETARRERPLFCAVSKAGRLLATGLSDKAVVRLVKQAAAAAGLDPARYAGHSLRAGLATAAGDAGADLAALMRQTRHQSTAVALGYLHPAELWRNNVTARVFGRPDKAGGG
jgi:site-specific recombinase XerD